MMYGGNFGNSLIQASLLNGNSLGLGSFAGSGLGRLALLGGGAVDTNALVQASVLNGNSLGLGSGLGQLMLLNQFAAPAVAGAPRRGPLMGMGNDALMYMTLLDSDSGSDDDDLLKLMMFGGMGGASSTQDLMYYSLLKDDSDSDDDMLKYMMLSGNGFGF